MSLSTVWLYATRECFFVSHMSAAKNVSQAPNLLILYMTIRMLFFVAVVYVHVQNEVVIYHMMITCLITHTHLTMLKISYIIKGLSKAPLQMCQTSQIIFLPAFLFSISFTEGGEIRPSSVLFCLPSFPSLSFLRSENSLLFSFLYFLFYCLSLSAVFLWMLW